MIKTGQVLESIRAQLEQYFKDSNLVRNPEVVLGNVALVDAVNSSTLQIRNKVIVSLVNIEEENTLRFAHKTTFIPRGEVDPSKFISHNPIVYLNLYVLFSCPRDDDKYKESLDYLSVIIHFFQWKGIFYQKDIPELKEAVEIDRITFELFSLSFEQMNHLWGVLGGKYMPSVMYKVRVLPVKDLPETPTALIKKEIAHLDSQT